MNSMVFPSLLGSPRNSLLFCYSVQHAPPPKHPGERTMRYEPQMASFFRYTLLRDCLIIPDHAGKRMMKGTAKLEVIGWMVGFTDNDPCGNKRATGLSSRSWPWTTQEIYVWMRSSRSYLQAIEIPKPNFWPCVNILYRIIGNWWRVIKCRITAPPCKDGYELCEIDYPTWDYPTYARWRGAGEGGWWRMELPFSVKNMWIICVFKPALS